jgi:deoxyribodipyrimidine photo-lyase
VAAPTVWWIRRDLRLADNAALATAIARGGPVVPLFVRDPHLLRAGPHARAEKRQAFLHAGLRALAAALARRGARLVVRTGRPDGVLRRIVAETGATAVVAHADVSPYARRRDARVARAVPLALVPGVAVHAPGDVLKADGTPFTVFTPFRRAWLARGLPRAADVLPAPESVPAPAHALVSEPVPDGEPPEPFPSGEDEAQRRLAAFASGRRAPIHAYARDRSRLDRDGTSVLSPYLRFGMLSARQAAVAARAAGAGRGDAGADAWLAELAWRDFYLAILWHFPAVLTGPFAAAFRRFEFRQDEHALEAWRAGRTGYPVVDAAMRQLAAIGWMHNRARMIVASFLTKHLLLDWRAGEAWFLRQLVDGDPAANNGGWQWTAGSGTDPSPYFRIFNPVLQARKFDPDGVWVRRWVPELARVPAARLQQPWTMSPAEQRAAGVVVGRDYPAPIVEQAAARARALAAWRAARGRSSA